MQFIRWALLRIYRILYSSDGHCFSFIAFYIHPMGIIEKLSHFIFFRWALLRIYRILYSSDGHYLLFIAFFIIYRGGRRPTITGGPGGGAPR